MSDLQELLAKAANAKDHEELAQLSGKVFELLAEAKKAFEAQFPAPIGRISLGLQKPSRADPFGKDPLFEDFEALTVTGSGVKFTRLGITQEFSADQCTNISFGLYKHDTKSAEAKP